MQRITELGKINRLLEMISVAWRRVYRGEANFEDEPAPSGAIKTHPLRRARADVGVIFNVALSGVRSSTGAVQATDTALNMQIRRYNVPRDRGVIHIAPVEWRRAMFIVERHD